MSLKTQTRVVPTSASNGYGPGRWLAQYHDHDMDLWFDIGDPHDTRAQAEQAEADYQKEPRS